MDNLPLNVVYEIFYVTDIEYSLALTCYEFYSILSCKNFWVQRLDKIGLPVLEEGKSFAQWREIYHYSLQVHREEKKQTILLSLSSLPSLQYMVCPEVKKEKVCGFLSLARKYRSYKHSSEIFLQVSPQGYKIFSTEKSDFFTSKFYKRTLFYTNLSEQSYHLLLYKLTYIRR